MTDQELDEIVSEIKHDFPNCGSRLMYGHLVGRGHRVSHARICESLHRVEPEVLQFDGLRLSNDASTLYFHPCHCGILTETTN